MKFLVISDMHGAAGRLDELAPELKAADAVLFAGDFAEFDHPETGEPALKKLCDAHDTIFSVIGNCDEPAFLSDIEEKDISVQGALLYHDGLAFAGCGGGTRFNGSTPNERDEAEMMEDLSIAESLDGSKDSGCAETAGMCDSLIVIAHNPPKDTGCDQVAPGVHVGSAMLRKFIESKQPLAVITGHIHEGVAVDHIGATTVINPGPLADGLYAVMEIEKQAGTWKVTKAELRKL